MRERARGKIMLESSEYNKNRRRFVDVLNKINAVANQDGKGRDDLHYDILVQAEGICRRISSIQSKAVRKLAESIKKSFASLRHLMRKYGENIEAVDPQLKNNPDLVDDLEEFERAWEKGKAYFVSPKRIQQLVHFSSVIEATATKYRAFNEQVQDRDTDIFVSIPALLILKCLDEDDKGICRAFFPPMYGEDAVSGDESEAIEPANVDKEQVTRKFAELREKYQECRAKSRNEYDFFNLVERSILGMEQDETPCLKDEQLRAQRARLEAEYAENGLTAAAMQKII